jgi:transcriptional regulator with XRE-family HTH domain
MFGDELRAALTDARISQAQLARELQVDPGQVSRWVNNKTTPHRDTVVRIEQFLGTDLSASLSASTPDYELYVSAPITGLNEQDIRTHHSAVAEVVATARRYVNSLYWPGERILESTDLAAPDIATERNMRVLAECSALLYLQFVNIVRPSGALIELGVALGRRLKTTVIMHADVPQPYMLSGFGAVAATLSFLPQARIYTVRSVGEACDLIQINGRELLGLTETRRQSRA